MIEKRVIYQLALFAASVMISILAIYFVAYGDLSSLEEAKGGDFVEMAIIITIGSALYEKFRKSINKRFDSSEEIGKNNIDS